MATIKSSIEKGVLTISCGEEEIMVTGMDLSPEVRAHAVLHGMKQRLVDAAALSRNSETGLPASPDEKWAEVKKLAQYYLNGAEQWNLPRGEGGTRDTSGLTIRAMMKVYGLTSAGDVLNMVSRLAVKRNILEKKALAVFRETADVQRAIAEIKAGMSKVDAASLLDEIG